MKQQEPVYVEIDECGDKRYYSDRKMTVLHRLDGPAVEYADGYKAWCINGKYLTEAEFLAATAPKEVHEMTLDDIAARLGISVERLKIIKEH